KWLNDNKERDAAPYSIKHVEWKLVAEETVAKDPNAPQAPGATPGPQTRGGPVRPAKGFENPEDYVPPEDIVRGYNPPGGGSGGGSGGDVNQLAPVPKAPPIAEPGAKIRTFEIKWEAYLKS